MRESDENPNPKNNKKKFWDRYIGLILGLPLLLAGWLLFSILGENHLLIRSIGALFLLLGVNLFLSPFEKPLKKLQPFKFLLGSLEFLLLLGVVLLFVFASLMSVYFAVILVLFSAGMPIMLGLEKFGVSNSTEISLFLSGTFTAIIFSYSGNSIINWVVSLLRRKKKEDIQDELKIINTYLGQNQIRFLIYLAYFFLIILLTVFDLAQNLEKSTDQNLIYLTLQSFAAFIAFEAMIEKRALMKPWVVQFEKLNSFIKEISPTSKKTQEKKED